MTLMLGMIILVNIVGFQWALFASIYKGKKIDAMLDQTLSKSARLKIMSAGAVSMAFYKSTLVA